MVIKLCISSIVSAFFSSNAIFLTRSLGSFLYTADLIHLSDRSSDGSAFLYKSLIRATSSNKLSISDSDARLRSYNSLMGLSWRSDASGIYLWYNFRQASNPLATLCWIRHLAIPLVQLSSAAWIALFHSPALGYLAVSCSRWSLTNVAPSPHSLYFIKLHQ